jgi:hypothetical protein
MKRKTTEPNVKLRKTHAARKLIHEKLQKGKKNEA